MKTLEYSSKSVINFSGRRKDLYREIISFTFKNILVMAKNLLVTLLVCLLPLGATQIIAGPATLVLESTPLNFNGCDAPPPDSFRVTNISSEAVSLAWTPVSIGATHTLVVFEEDSSGNLTNLATYYSVPGITFTVAGLSPGSYIISNATNCPNGETSFRNSEVRFKLIELTTAGRIPVNPVAVSDCSMINFKTHEWVGFNVIELATGRNNMFEFRVEGDVALVKRVYANQIVAVNQDGEFPIGNQHLGVAISFKMDDKSKSIEEQAIGFVEITQYFGNLSQFIGICKDLSNPPTQWKPFYKFIALTAESVQITFPQGGPGTGQGLIRPITESHFIAQNPFTNNLSVFIKNTPIDVEDANIYLLNCKGDVVLKQKFSLQSQEIILNTDSLLPGLYILNIASNMENRTLKIIKL